MRRFCFLVCSSVFLSLLCACVTPFEQNFVDLRPQIAALSSSAVILHKVKPTIRNGTEVASETTRLMESGYACVGYSFFNESFADWGGAQRHAAKIGAEFVVAYSKYTHTLSGVAPVTVPNPDQTIVTQHEATAIGTLGFASGTGTSTTTIPGGYSTYYVPWSSNRFNFLAVYWAPVIDVLGAYYTDLTPELAQKLKRNQGVVITNLIRGGPAYRAQVVPGDVVVELEAQVVDGALAFDRALGTRQGKTVILKVLRESGPIQIQVQLASLPTPTASNATDR